MSLAKEMTDKKVNFEFNKEFINVFNKKIIPCGISDKRITSLKKMGIKNLNNIDKIIIKKFLNTFPSVHF